MTGLLAFVASGTLVVLAGAALARHADAIADSTRLGRWWIGSLLLAGATSLPELATDVTAVRLNATDLAAGDLFGSSVANMMIFALLVQLPPARAAAAPAVAPGHLLTAALAILLNALAAMLVLLRLDVAAPFDPGALALFALYALGTRASYGQAVAEGVAVPPPAHAGRASVRRPALAFGAAAGIVLLAAPVFAWSARELAALTGLGNTFFGTWLVGLATSLPELVASIAALRLRAFDLAVGNLFGSNAFNMAIFAVLDAFQRGPVFAALDASHAITGLSAAALMSLGLAALVYRSRAHRPGLLAVSAGMVVLYGVTLWASYGHAAAG